MSLDRLEFDIVDQLEEGKYKFTILDINKATYTGENDEDIHYLNFKLLDTKSKLEYDNLLSVPLNLKTYRISDSSQLGHILKTFGILKPDTKTLNNEMINMLVKRDFTANVIHKEVNNGIFAKINIESIST